jgi:hypothetical protein
VSIDKAEEFVKIANDIVGQQLRGEKNAGNDNA